jgi:hypothetical protein
LKHRIPFLKIQISFSIPQLHHQDLEFSSDQRTFAHGVLIRVTDPSDHSVILALSRPGEMIIHVSDFYFEFVVPFELDSRTLWGASIAISPASEVAVVDSSTIASSHCEFVTQMKILDRDWKREHDKFLSPHVKSANFFGVLPPTSGM